MSDHGHARRVAGTFDEGTIEWAVGFLHDVIEDGEATEQHIRETLNPAVAEAVVCLTRRPGETYARYIERVAVGPAVARRVKIADLRDNLARMDADHESLRGRYERALERLLLVPAHGLEDTVPP